MAPDTRESAAPALKDARLLRQQCYVDGKWIDVILMEKMLDQV